MEILYRANRVFLWCAFTSKPIVVIKESMNSRRNASRRLKEEDANAGDPPHGGKVPPLEENANFDQAPANPRPMTGGEDEVYSYSNFPSHDYSNRSREGSSISYDGPSQLGYCSPSLSTSHYYGFPSKGYYSNKPSYFLWVLG